MAPGRRVGRPEVVLITGASGGVGRATARSFASRGARICLVARGREGLEAARVEVEDLGGKALVHQADVAAIGALEQAATAAEEAFGPLDIWVNNAMATIFSPFEDVTPEEYRRVTEVTYLGFVYGTMAALKRMKPRDQGVIVQVGSALAYRGIPLQSAYCGAKHAVQGFTESLRCELRHDRSNVHLTMVQLPALNTPQFGWQQTRLGRRPQPVPPIYQPEIAAEAIYWAAHHRRRELYVGYPTVATIVGNKLLPSLGDVYLAKTGYESQQYNGPPPPGQPSNLWEPVDEDRGAHGDFDARSKERSPQLWTSMHRRSLALAAGAAGGVAALIWRRLR